MLPRKKLRPLKKLLPSNLSALLNEKSPGGDTGAFCCLLSGSVSMSGVEEGRAQRREIIKFASIRVVTRNVAVLRDYYAALTGATPTDLAPGFSEIRLDGCTLALSSEEIINTVNGGVIVPEANRSSMIELEVDDVEAVKARVVETGLGEIAQQPTTMPWGNVSMLLRDPDGAVVNIFSRPKR